MISCAHVCMCNDRCLKQAVGRGARTPLVVGDMPFGSYEVSPKEALRTAIRFVKVRRRRRRRPVAVRTYTTYNARNLPPPSKQFACTIKN